jgi:hypothetical protein
VIHKYATYTEEDIKNSVIPDFKEAQSQEVFTYWLKRYVKTTKGKEQLQ